MHARYYDPEIGRFIMKDPVSGYLSKLIGAKSNLP
jgi:RHS repeat-associated protein